jgi:OmpA-OmpF porin, OOP family
MRCNPIRWLLGLMPILLLAGVAILGERERIEKDLTARARVALDQAGLAWVQTKFEGRDARVSGPAYDEGEPARAARAVAGTHGVRIVHNATRLIDKAERYNWVAARRDNRVRLGGLVPNEKTRREIIGLARAMFPSYEIADRMDLARGAPSLDTWLGGVGFGLKQLALLKTGQVRLDMTEMTVLGEAIDAAGYRSVKTALATGLPPGISLKADNVEAPIASPYVWAARLSDGQLDVRGSVLNEKVRADLLTVARRAMPNAKLVDAMQPARGASDGWEAVARVLLRELARLEEGSVEIRDQNVTVAGMATKEATADDIRAKLTEGIPAGYRMTDRIEFREPTIKPVSPYQTTITFDDGAATLAGYVPSEAARAALVGLVQTRVPGSRIVDRLELGVGQIPGWQRCLDAGLAAVAKLGGTGRLSLTDRRLVVGGATESEALHKTVPTETRAAANRDCDPDFQIALKLRPEPMLTWTATASSDGLILEGQVPGNAVRDELLAVAKKQFPSREVTDRMVVVGEPSERWKQAATVALTQLARLRLGDAQIVNQVMSIKGEARDVVVQAAVKAEIGRALPEGYVGQEAIAVRPDATIAIEQASKLKAEDDLKRREAEAEAQRIAAAAAARQKLEAEEKQRADAAEAERQAAAVQQQLETEARQRAEAEAKQLAADEAELRRQRFARHAEEERRRREAEEAAHAREAAAARQRAELEAKDRAEDTARRRAETEARWRAEETERRRIVDEAAKLQRNLEAHRVNQERARKQGEADVCGNVLQTVAKNGIILFDWASVVLDRRSHPTLRRLAEAARACPDVTIEIEGHTDSEGNDERNQPLSERRAQSVVDFLIKAGVPAERMKAVGYGSTRPLVPNDSEENRARNRRIGFTVKVK